MPTIDRINRIAIVGVGGIFPGAPTLDAFWKNISLGIDSGRHVPPERWTLSPNIAFDSAGPKPDRVFSTWGCFIEDFQFDPSGLNLDGRLLERLDPLFHLGLHAARSAFLDAKQLATTDLTRVGVILGNIALPTESTSAMCRDVLGRTLIEKLIETMPVANDRREAMMARIWDGAKPQDWHPSNRFAASLPAAMIAQGLNLGGSAYTLDAACASSLYALKFACEELHSGRADAMLAGGMSRPDCQYTQMGFAQLKALSRRGRCSPLSAAADGLVVGEGAGVFVLKRLQDALAAGDQIYGVIAGIGLSNDRGANLLAPHSEGQLRAMRSAYEQAGWRPSDVDLIECHATGTPVGDSVEIDSLHQLWQDENTRPGQCVIGGVKSNVGHLLTGAGAAGLIKVLLALKHQTLPPTANYDAPATALNNAQTPFRVLSRAEPWLNRSNRQGTSHAAPSWTTSAVIPRRATVNAFGFGGINAHVLIEEYSNCSDQNRTQPAIRQISIPAALRATSSPNTIRPQKENLAVAIVGLAVHLGDSASLPECRQQLSKEPLDASRSKESHAWGVEQSNWFRREFGTRFNSESGLLNPITSVHLPLGEFRIPPLEMQDMLPQQQLMLKVAAKALQSADCQKKRVPASVQSSTDHSALASETLESPAQLGNRTGVFIGIELDPNTTNFHLRWSIEQDAPQWAKLLGLVLTPSEMADWINRLKDSIGPALTANRVMGNLGGIVASRLAREFNVGGPSFTISADQNSGLRACELAANALHRGELDRAIVGAVDLPCDIRSLVAKLRANTHQSPQPICDGAAAIVLKRLDDALRDGDSIYALIHNFEQDHSASKIPIATFPAAVGAATGLITLAAAIEALNDQVLDDPVRQPWLHNRQEGARQIVVTGFGLDGRNLKVQLSEAQNDVVSESAILHNHALAAGIFTIDGDSVAEISSALDQLATHIFACVERRHADQVSRTPVSVHQLAKDWFHERPPRSDRQLALTLVVKSLDELPEVIRLGAARLHDDSIVQGIDRRVHFLRRPLGRTGRMAFVFPGSGNAFCGMGRELLAAFPDVLRRQDAENRRLRDQYNPDLIWNRSSAAALMEDHKGMIFGQVALGTAICDLLALFRIRPMASIGYSLGESAALFGLRAWTDRDEMLQRMDDATLFGSDLVKPFDAARKAWNVPDGVEVDWTSGVIDRPAAEVQKAIANSLAPALRGEGGGEGISFSVVTAPVDTTQPDQTALHNFASSTAPQVYLLIINTPTQCVIGGRREDVVRLVRELNATFVSFSAPSTVHCEILRQVEPAYRALHFMRTTPQFAEFQPTESGGIGTETDPQSVVASNSRPIDFYSTAWGHAYDLSSDTAADAIVAQALDTIDFPRVIERAYADGVRLFVEIGPGSSCTRMIDEILNDRPHLVRSATPATSNPVAAFLELIAVLIAERVPVDLSYLYGNSISEGDAKPITAEPRSVVTKTGGAPFEIPIPTTGWRFDPEMIHEPKNAIVPIPLPPHHGKSQTDFTTQRPIDHDPPSIASTPLCDSADEEQFTLAQLGNNVISQFHEIMAARIKAHETYLRVSAEIQRAATEQLLLLTRLSQLEPEGASVTAAGIPSVASQNSEFNGEQNRAVVQVASPQVKACAAISSRNGQAEQQDTMHSLASMTAVSPAPREIPPRSLTRSECMEFAIGKIGRVLGTMFAEIDQYPTRVRLPDEPLMLVDRILEIEGEPCSMTSGRVVTEHDIHPSAWYLDCNRIPTCIAVEAGQADLFLSGWLGIDFETKGKACYRLLDAVVTFHRELPLPGEVIHYDIRINNFFRQGQTYLFRFEFDATVNGQALLTMREGCAGFFTEAELAGGKGIVHTALDRQPRSGKRPADWGDLVEMASESYDDSQLLALRHGQLEVCFGAPFRGLPLTNPVTLPGLVPAEHESHSGEQNVSTGQQRSRMWLIDRVLKLDPAGGKFGIGTILGELDIHPDDWFITCHFCDDQVMPGTLMYECCLHTLRIYLLRMGWIGETGQIVYEPIPGIRSRLKCRGQVLATTQKVWYEITLKEIGYTTDEGGSESGAAYCIADALMYADGKPIVEITDMSVRLTGLTRPIVERLWHNRWAKNAAQVSQVSLASNQTVSHHKQVHYDRRPALFDTDRITAFAIGNPSDAFGDRYRVFDAERVIARLPGPPFQFLDRVVSINGCEQWVLQAGGEVVAQYDVPRDAWYFAANRQRCMPFAVLLETALQPCGWLAGYVGSALTSETDLSFRNLGGTATQFREVAPESGTLTTTVKMTRVSNSGGMIIQHYDFDLRCDGEPVYVGNTYFGFFSKASLANQVGIRDAKPFVPSPEELVQASSFAYVDAAPFADSQFQMIDDVQVSMSGGPFGQGFVVGTTSVDPTSWFFKAHFHQDPVVPGSLGLESFFQLLKLYAAYRWQLGENAQFATPLIQGQSANFDPKHEWVYRGQIVPRDHRVMVSAVIKQVNDSCRELIAEGFLSVDGRVIYQMKNFSMGCV